MAKNVSLPLDAWLCRRKIQYIIQGYEAVKHQQFLFFREVTQAKNRYEVGLQKLKTAASEVCGDFCI